ncbi:hypothetical protein RRG08_027951 [Elysia crispata]|uniref:Uncharacterized protein n=1 Tax=Elysia crispata TaxID=231223 RepID=A0AAE0ZJ87_9GAST|nr:hypothetical protein RRG08_027951 [Elysia crispata]
MHGYIRCEIINIFSHYNLIFHPFAPPPVLHSENFESRINSSLLLDIITNGTTVPQPGNSTLRLMVPLSHSQETRHYD